MQLHAMQSTAAAGAGGLWFQRLAATSTMAAFTSHPSHQIFGRMYEALNVDKKISNCIVYL
jgi:hypothetical protein